MCGLEDEDFRENLVFVSMYIAVYEHMTDYVVSNLKYFLCNVGIEDGKEVLHKTKKYREKIEERIVDNHGNKDKLKASFLWFVDSEAISQDDYQCFLETKKIRNKYVHELLNVIMQGGVTESEIKLFLKMYKLYQKISKWWFVNIDIFSEDEIPENIDIENVRTVADIFFGEMLRILYPKNYTNKGEECRC